MTFKTQEDQTDAIIRNKNLHQRRGERSFSLLETIIAVSLVAILMVEVSGVHGNSIAFSQYGRKVLQASYLAKRLMSQIEYQSSIRSPIKDIATEVKDQPFEDAPEFTYSLSIKPLPKSLDLMMKLMSGGLAGGADKEGEKSDSSGAGAILEQLKSMIEQAVGEDPIWLAKVEVSWPEGARRGSTEVAMILTDVKKLEDSVGKIMDSATVPAGGTPAAGPPGVPANTPQNRAPGTGVGGTSGGSPANPGPAGGPI